MSENLDSIRRNSLSNEIKKASRHIEKYKISRNKNINNVKVTNHFKEFTKRLCDLADEVDGISSSTSESVFSHKQEPSNRLNHKLTKERRVTWDEEINREKFFDQMKGFMHEEKKTLHSSFKKSNNNNFLSNENSYFQKYRYEIKEAPEEEDEYPLKINLTLCPCEPPEAEDRDFSNIANCSENLTKETESCKSNKKSNSSSSIDKRKKKKKVRKASKRETCGNLEEFLEICSKSPIEKLNARKYLDTPLSNLNHYSGPDFTEYLNITREKSKSLYKISQEKLQKTKSHPLNDEKLPHKQDMLNMIDTLKELEETLFAQEESDD